MLVHICTFLNSFLWLILENCNCIHIPLLPLSELNAPPPQRKCESQAPPFQAADPFCGKFGSFKCNSAAPLNC